MSETIGVFVAWPNPNGDLHLGRVAGVYLPADIFARYHRLRGNRVLMVSGSDAHGTPVTVSADAAGVSPRALFERNHRRFLDDWQNLGISFDLFTHTDTENHHAVARDIFRALYERGHITVEAMQQLYCEADARFLPDRYAHGTCPHCRAQARGDQCEACGRMLDAIDLIDPVCSLCSNRPVVRETEHFFFDLAAFEEQLLTYVEGQTHWRAGVRNFARSYLQEGLQPRAFSRDLDWGVPVPVAGYEDKVLYVWIEAVVGYLSASIEWARLRDTPNVWETWWRESDARGYYFLGKDNIPFHAIIWPAELLAHDRTLQLPYDIPANEFLILEGHKFSSSRGWAVWLPDVLERYGADPLRYYLTRIAPESGDSDFTWQGFLEANNNELLATWGNLVNRVVSFAYRRWDGRVPTPGELGPNDRALLTRIADGFDTVGAHYAACEFKAGLRATMTLAQTVNRYLDEQAPWHQIETGRTAAATTMFVALRAVDSLATQFAPVLPFSSRRVRHMLGYDEPLFGELSVGRVAESEREHEVLRYRPLPVEGTVDRWRPSELPAGRRLRQPEPLFEKLDEAIVEQERERLNVGDRSA